MKHHKVIAAIVAAACLWIGGNSAFAADLVWQTSKEAAVSLALSQGKKILLIGGDETCSRTERMLKLCETTSPPLKSLIEQHFVPWFGNRNAVPNSWIYNTDWYRYAIGLGTFPFPLICVIDPNDSKDNAYLDRTVGVQDIQVFYDRLLKFTQEEGATTCTCTISPVSAVLGSSANHTPFGDSGNKGTVAVKTSGSSCSWSAKSNASWITITAGSSGTGDGTVTYSVSDNTAGSTRTGTLTIEGQTFTVTQEGATTCTSTISPTSAVFGSSADHTPFGDAGNKGTVAVKTSGSSCSWSATSNASWITITAGSSGTGDGTVTYSVAANTTGSARTGTLTIGGQTLTVTQNGDTTQDGANTNLYFPHVDTSLPWQTEIAIINTGDQEVTGTLRAFSNDGQLLETMDVTLGARGRRQIIVASEFTYHADTGYIIFDTDSPAVQGYTEFYMSGIYGAAIPAVKEVNTSDIYISHIDSSDQWWTAVSLVNTTSETKELTLAFNNGQSRNITLNANEHRALNIADLFDNEPQPDIKSAVIVNANGIIGLELFGSADGSNQMEGILLTDKTASTLYYPQVGNDGWWTGIAAYNPSDLSCAITITPYDTEGIPLTPSTLSIEGKGKYIGSVAALGFPAETAWFRIDSTGPLTGFELFGTEDGNQLAAYTGGVGTGAKEGVFPKIEKNGWTGITFVNTEAAAATVSLTAYDDNGSVVATSVLPVGGYARVIRLAEALFSNDISGATYIAYSSDTNILGFQLNGSTDGTVLDGLPGM